MKCVEMFIYRRDLTLNKKIVEKSHNSIDTGGKLVVIDEMVPKLPNYTFMQISYILLIASQELKKFAFKSSSK